MRIPTRLAKLEQALTNRLRTAPFEILEVVPRGDERAEGREVGLHRVGSTGSTAGLLVFDPTQGELAVPPCVLPPWGLIIRCHLPHEEPSPKAVDS